jgi:PAS domain S-box-containing protein
VTDASGTIREANRAATALLHVEPKHLMDAPLSVFIASEDLREFLGWLNGPAHEPGVHEREIRLLPRGSEPFPALLNVTARHDGAGQVTGLLWTLRNVSKRKAAEEALRQERDLAQSLVETAQAVVLVLDLDGRILRFNPYLEELAGYDLAEVQGQDWFSVFVPAPLRAEARKSFFAAAGNEHIQRAIHPIRTRDGRERHIHWSNKRLRDGTGRATAVLATGHDITELNGAQQRALQAERLAAIGQMVSGLSHEGRNALQRSQACLEMLALELRDRPDARNLVDRVQSAQNHLLTLYEEVQAYAAPLRLTPTVCDLGDLVREAFGRIEMLHKGRRLVLHDGRPGLDLSCAVDAPLVRRLVCNILENAVSASEGPVDIRLNWTETELDGCPALQMGLRDNGPGLTAEQQARIFDPFFTTKTHGIGLGMAVAQRIVEAHDGRIAVGSSQGPGTELLVTLPRRRP